MWLMSVEVVFLIFNGLLGQALVDQILWQPIRKGKQFVGKGRSSAVCLTPLQSLQPNKIEGAIGGKPMCFHKGVKNGGRTTISSGEVYCWSIFRIVFSFGSMFSFCGSPCWYQVSYFYVFQRGPLKPSGWNQRDTVVNLHDVRDTTRANFSNTVGNLIIYLRDPQTHETGVTEACLSMHNFLILCQQIAPVRELNVRSIPKETFFEVRQNEYTKCDFQEVSTGHCVNARSIRFQIVRSVCLPFAIYIFRKIETADYFVRLENQIPKVWKKALTTSTTNDSTILRVR